MKDEGKHSGWWVMVKEENGKWFAVGCVSEDNEAFFESWYPEFDVILPIPERETVPEFGGF